MIVPIRLTLPGSWQLLFDPELDVLENADLGGQHVNVVGLVNVSHPFTKTITVSAELWEDSNFDPAGTTNQVSADANAAWIPPTEPNLQFDAGVNFGVNRATPGAQLFVGVSRRF